METQIAGVPADPRAAYELWADSYPAVAHNPLMQLEQDIVEGILARLHPNRALDVGTGSGRYLPVLARAGATSVVGVDFSMAMLKSAHRHGEVEEAVVCGDARRLPFRPRSFDVINASLMAGDIADLGSWLREIAGALTRGGHLVYSDFHPSWAEHGWKRSFRGRDGREHDVGFTPHSIDEHVVALAGAGLRTIAIREPCFKSDTDAGVRAFRRRWRNPPVVVVLHATNEP